MKGKTVALGMPLDDSDEELDMAALVSREDILDAQATARQRMTAPGRELLETEKAGTPPAGEETP